MPTIPQLPVGDKAAAPDAPIGNPLAEGLPPPTEAQIKEFFGKRSAVIPLGVPTDHSGPAVYFIRHQGGDPVQRWMGRDDCRILYIGSSGTGKSNMAARSRQMQ